MQQSEEATTGGVGTGGASGEARSADEINHEGRAHRKTVIDLFALGGKFEF